MTIRTRRLRRDYEKIISELAGSECARIKVVAGDPPYHYQVIYRVKGLVWDAVAGNTRAVDEHVVDINLPQGYPKLAPRCTMRVPAWHPNIGDYVCIGDFWSAGVALVDIIAHIGDMIQYKTYNLRSPVNKAAAAWAELNARSFPVGTRNIIPPQSEHGDEDLIIAPASIDLDTEISLGPIRDRH